MRAANEPVNTGSWLSRREIPTSAELLGNVVDADDGDGGDELEVPVNVVQGSWGSKEYLSTHYELLRECGAVAPLRDAVAEVREVPSMMDSQAICIYENVW
jgi:helicase required for RNAi-mediated heterochromatin assembly 1